MRHKTLNTYSKYKNKNNKNFKTYSGAWMTKPKPYNLQFYASASLA
jgi:hypothetical protein